MTLQTSAPLERMHLSDSCRGARELVRMLDDGHMTYDAPYQRGSVWNTAQRIELIRSWLTGTPIASIIVNDRINGTWTDVNGEIPAGEPFWSVIDGKQRLETVRLWFHGELAVPASWFDDADIDAWTSTRDGFYVTYTGLGETKQRMLACHASQRDWLMRQHGIDEYLRLQADWGAHRGAEIGVAQAEGFRQYLGHPYPHDNLLLSLIPTP